MRGKTYSRNKRSLHVPWREKLQAVRQQEPSLATAKAARQGTTDASRHGRPPPPVQRDAAPLGLQRDAAPRSRRERDSAQLRRRERDTALRRQDHARDGKPLALRSVGCRSRRQDGYKGLEGGFTLIELLIVVVIMSVIGLFVVSSTLRMLSSQKRSIARQAPKAVEQQAPQVVAVTKEAGQIRQIPLQAVIATKVKVGLEVDYLLDEGRVTPTYQANFQGRYRLQNPLFRATRVRLFFPFPAGAGTFSEMSFLVSKPIADPAFFAEESGASLQSSPDRGGGGRLGLSVKRPTPIGSISRPAKRSEVTIVGSSGREGEAAPKRTDPTGREGAATSKPAKTLGVLAFGGKDAGRLPSATPTPTAGGKTDLSLTDLQGLYAPRQGVKITDQGVFWDTLWPAGVLQEAYIRYRVRGRDKYQYQIAAGKKDTFDFSMVVQGAFPEIPAKALQPLELQRTISPETTTLSWSFQNFLTIQDIEVRFPPHFAKFHRFGLLGRMAWIAVLFFAFFFWYFAERSHADKVVSSGATTVNFGLLIVGFLSFFPLFLYLEEHIALALAFSAALTISALLTTVHVALFVDLRWALSRSLPLQVFFTAGFVFAILSPTYRPLTLTLGAIFLIAVFVVFHARYQGEVQRQKALADKERQEEALRSKRLADESRRTPPLSGLASASFASLPSPHPIEAAPSEAPKPVAISSPKPPLPIEIAPPTPRRFCLFCGTSVDPAFKHCPDCGKYLRRMLSCGVCQSVYWYPTVRSFRYCQDCGTPLLPDRSVLPFDTEEKAKET